MNFRMALAGLFLGLMMLGCNLAGLVQANGETTAPPIKTVEVREAAPAGDSLQPEAAVEVVDSGNLLQPQDFTYLGAFRLPGEEDRPRTFAYGGNAMTFNPGW